MSKLYDVVIAGAGPVGLFLACELGLARASVLVLERDVQADSLWKALPLGRRSLNTQSMEALYRRGLLDKLFDADKLSPSQKPGGFRYGGVFAGIMLNASNLDLNRFKYRLPGPALFPNPSNIQQVEQVLTERAESLGVTIVRGDGVTEITGQEDDIITVEAGKDQFYRGKWLVGCDGGRSVVRKAANFGFIGTEAKFTGYVAQCSFDEPHKLKPGFHVTKSGMYIMAPPDSLYLVDFDGAAFDRTQEITKEHLQTVLARVSGITDVKITDIQLSSSFTDRTKQATSYRKGRVLLAGDAAHIHSPVGAQGLNLGLGDAMNLGWKLAATVHRGPEPDLTLLDTYDSERRPLGATVLEWTRAQVSLLQPDMSNAHAIVREMVNTVDGTNLMIDQSWGLSQRYDLGDGKEAHSLVGRSAPDFQLSDGSRLGPKLMEGRGLLLDFSNSGTLKQLIGSDHGGKVDYLAGRTQDQLGLDALLIRPDGVVVWVAEENVEPDVDAAKAALRRWFSS